MNRLRELESLRAEPGLAGDTLLDTLGLYCPVPILRTAEAIAAMGSGALLEVLSDDRVVLIDMPAWCVSNRHEYLGFREEGTQWRLFVRKR